MSKRKSNAFALLFLLLVRFLNADIVAEELDLDETGKAAGDLFGVKLFQQSTICDIGGDDGGQLCTQPVVQQTVQIGEKEAGIELGAKIIEDQQVGIGCSLEQRFFLAVRVGTKMQRFQLAKEIRAGDIDHIIVLPEHLSGNGQRRMGLAKTGISQQQQALAGGR